MRQDESARNSGSPGRGNDQPYVWGNLCALAAFAWAVATVAELRNHPSAAMIAFAVVAVLSCVVAGAGLLRKRKFGVVALAFAWVLATAKSILVIDWHGFESVIAVVPAGLVWLLCSLAMWEYRRNRWTLLR